MNQIDLDRDSSVVELLKKKLEEKKEINKDFIISYLPTLANTYKEQISKAFENGKKESSTSYSGERYYNKKFGEVNKIFIPESYRMVRARFISSAIRGDKEYSQYSNTQKRIEKVLVGHFFIDKEGFAYLKTLNDNTSDIPAEDVTEWEYISDQEAFPFQIALKSKKFAIIGWDKKALNKLEELIPLLKEKGCITGFSSDTSEINSIEDIFTYKYPKEKTYHSKTCSEYEGITLEILSNGKIHVERYLDTRKWLRLSDGLEDIKELGIEIDELELDLEGPDVNRLTSDDVKRIKKTLTEKESFTYTALTDYSQEDKIYNTEEKTIIYDDKDSCIFKDGFIYLLTGNDSNTEDLCTVKEAEWFTKIKNVECVVSPKYNKRDTGSEFCHIKNGVSKECSYSEFWGHSTRSYGEYESNPKLPFLKRLKCTSIENGLIMKHFLENVSKTSFYTTSNSILNFRYNAISSRVTNVLKIGESMFIVKYVNSESIFKKVTSFSNIMKKESVNKNFDEIANTIKENGNVYQILDLFKVIDPKLYIANK